MGEQGLFAGERVELVRGLIFTMSPRGSQWVMTKLARLLVEAVGMDDDVRVQLPFAATDDSEAEPAFAVIAKLAKLGPTPSQAKLIIEVSDSTLQFDREVKGRLYAESKVPEYWIVNLIHDAVEVRTNPGEGQYTRLETFGRDAKLRPTTIPNVEISIAAFLPPLGG